MQKRQTRNIYASIRKLFDLTLRHTFVKKTVAQKNQELPVQGEAIPTQRQCCDVQSSTEPVKTKHPTATNTEIKNIGSLVASFNADSCIQENPSHHLIYKIIGQFQEQFKSIPLSSVQELVVLAKIPDRDIYVSIIKQMISALKEEPLFNSLVLQGLAAAIYHCPEKVDLSNEHGIFLGVLLPLQKSLRAIHKENNNQQLVPLLGATSTLLDAMVDKGVAKVDREQIQEPLKALLNQMKQHANITISYQARYAQQALAYIGNNESFVRSVLRRGGMVLEEVTRIQAAISVSGLVSLLNPGLSISVFKNSKKALNFSIAFDWYRELRELDKLLSQRDWQKFRKFVRTSESRANVNFLQGVCERVEQLAITHTDRQLNAKAKRFLKSLASERAKQHVWVQASAQAALQRLDIFQTTASVERQDNEMPAVQIGATPRFIKDGDLLPVWHPIWYRKDNGTLLNAVRREEQRYANLDALPSQLVALKQEVTCIPTETVNVLEKSLVASEAVQAKTNATESAFTKAHKALHDYYQSNLHIQRINGDNLPDFASCYINLAVVKDQAKDKGQTDQHAAMLSHSLREEKLPYIPTRNLIAVETLFDKHVLQNGKHGFPKKIFIQGRAGIGKTTLCKKLVHEYINNGLWSEQFDAVLWIPLRQLKTCSAKNLEQLLHERYFAQSNNAEQFARDFLAHASNILIILDGLDEVNADLGKEDDLDKFLKTLLNQPNIIVTSRIVGVNAEALQNFDLKLETIGFTPENVTAYIKKHAAHSKTAIQNFIRRNSLVQGIVNIPVLLDALCYSWDELQSKMRAGSAITMTALYQAVLDKLSRKDGIRLGRIFVGLKIVQEYSFKQVEKQFVGEEIEFLGYLAHRGLTEKRIEFDLDFLRQCIDELNQKREQEFPLSLNQNIKQTSFLHVADSDLVTANHTCHFLHLTFQDFFAAKWLAAHLDPTTTSPITRVLSVEQTQQFVRERKGDPYYVIVWSFVSGLLKGRALEVFFDLLEEKSSTLSGLWQQYLIMGCLYESRTGLELARIDKCEKSFIDWFHTQIKFTGKSLLGAQPIFPEYLLLNFLKNKTALRIKRAAILTLGTRPELSEEAWGSLLALLDDDNEEVRIAAAKAINFQPLLPIEFIKGLLDLLPREKRGEHPLVVKILSKQQNLPTQIRLALLKLSNHKDKTVQCAAIEALDMQRDLSDEILKEYLIILLNQKSSKVRGAVTQLLGKQLPLSNIVFDLLIDLLKDDDEYVRYIAVKSLNRQPVLPVKALLGLITLLQGNNLPFQKRAANVLIKKQLLTDKIVEKIITLLAHKNTLISSTARKILVRQQQESHRFSSKAFQNLLELLKSNNNHVKSGALSVLMNRRFLPSDILSNLLMLYKDENSSSLRTAAVKVLGMQQSISSNILQDMTALLKGPNSKTRATIARVLGRQSSLPNEELQNLAALLEDKDNKVKFESAKALFRRHNLPLYIVEKLIKLLKDNLNFSFAEIKIFSKGNTSFDQEIKLLIERRIHLLTLQLKNDNSKKRLIAIKALGQYQSLPYTVIEELETLLQRMDGPTNLLIVKALRNQGVLPKATLQCLVSLLRLATIQRCLDLKQALIKTLAKQSSLPTEVFKDLITLLGDGSQVLVQIVIDLLFKHIDALYKLLPTLDAKPFELLYVNVLAPYELNQIRGSYIKEGHFYFYTSQGEQSVSIQEQEVELMKMLQQAQKAAGFPIADSWGET